jgi:hypothetical protein
MHWLNCAAGWGKADSRKSALSHHLVAEVQPDAAVVAFESLGRYQSIRIQNEPSPRVADL